MRYFAAPLVEKRQLNRDNFLLYFRDEEIASTALPGQFAMIAADTNIADPFPILMRPFSFFGVDAENRRFSILIKVVGLGTQLMVQFPIGAQVPMIGPLGNQFELCPWKQMVMVAGGVGIAPFYLLAQKLSGRGTQPVLFYGARSRDDLVTMEEFQSLNVEVHAATEDGSYGTRGFVTEPLARFLQAHADCDLMACGPHAMLAAVTRLAKLHRSSLQISVECFMGCGFGACFGCAVETVDGFRLACRYGPVFDGHKLKWDGLSHV
ncbi:MAG TPA: dihydroorotate dehydrogenase electron transfer subunit [Acidobacteriota bacterium]|nr:dihydroorotate dehydrogenase electron transfer subunit [Acidobacteriota bacterium]